MKPNPTPCVTALLAIALLGCGEDAMVANPALTRPGDFDGSDEGCEGLPLADDSLRVDLYEPSFSNPTEVTNPLFPIGTLERVVLLGSVEGLPLRVETTLLSRAKTVNLDGRRVETLVSQYVAWLDGRIHEVALDWYAQDDNGAVWYFGEDVFNYEDGRLADTEGTWLAGRDGPVAMIMPADPVVGDVWRPENICGFVFEEVTAIATGITVDGPRGLVSGALLTRELHMDGAFENKTFAPGYGEFTTDDPEGDVESVAIAIPIDALAGPVPEEVEELSDGAEQIFESAKSGAWAPVVAEFEAMEDAWSDFQATGVPPLLEIQMNDAMEELDLAVDAENRAGVRQASIHVAFAALDLELRHEEREEIDRDLLEVWSRQLELDMQARDRDAVRSDHVTIGWIRDRLGSR